MGNLVIDGEGVDVTISPEKFARIASGMGWLKPDEAEKLRHERDVHAKEKIAALEKELAVKDAQITNWRLRAQAGDETFKQMQKELAAAQMTAKQNEDEAIRQARNVCDWKARALKAEAATSEEARAVLEFCEPVTIELLREDNWVDLTNKMEAYYNSLKREPAASVEKTENLTYDEAKAAWESGKWVVPMDRGGWNPETLIKGHIVQVSKSQLWADKHRKSVTWSSNRAPFRIVTLTPEQQAIYDKWAKEQEKPKQTPYGEYFAAKAAQDAPKPELKIVMPSVVCGRCGNGWAYPAPGCDHSTPISMVIFGSDKVAATPVAKETPV